MKFWKMSAVSIILMLLATAAFGTGKQDTGLPETSEITTEWAWQMDTSPITLSVYAEDTWFAQWGDDPISQRITEETGVSLDVRVPAEWDEHGEQIKLMIASGDFTDYLFVSFNAPIGPELVEGDHLWALEDLIDNYAPKLRMLINNYVAPEILTEFREDDGKTYFWANAVGYSPLVQEVRKQLGGDDWSIGRVCFVTRQDVWEEVGSPYPKNADEFYQMLKAMKAKHPDMGGVEMVGGMDWWLTHFGISNQYYEKDGKLYYKMKDPKYVEMIKFLNKLAREDLLGKIGFIDGQQGWKSFETGQTLVVATNPHDWKSNQGMAEIGELGTYQRPLPFWETFRYDQTPNPWKKTAITKKTIDPVRAIRFLEFWSIPENSFRIQAGVPGEKWTGDFVNGPHFKYHSDIPSVIFPDKGRPIIFQEAFDGYNADAERMSRVWGLWYHRLLISEAINSITFNTTINQPPSAEWTEWNTLIRGYRANMYPERRISIPGDSDLGIIAAKIDSQYLDYQMKMIFADSEAAAVAAYNEVMEEIEKLGVAKLEAEHTRQMKANKERMGL